MEIELYERLVSKVRKRQGRAIDERMSCRQKHIGLPFSEDRGRNVIIQIEIKQERGIGFPGPQAVNDAPLISVDQARYT